MLALTVLRRALGILIIGASASCSVSPQSLHDYFPMKEGRYWRLASSERQFTLRVVGEAQLDDKTCWQVCLSISTFPKLDITYWMFPDNLGLWVMAKRTAGQFEKYEKPFLRFCILPGTRETLSSASGQYGPILFEKMGDETVHALNRDFPCKKVRRSWSRGGHSETEIIWYASGVGPIRILHHVVPDTGPESQWDYILEAFE